MNYISPKFLLFYGASIGFVLILFKLVTDYGETSLKAPPPMGGIYLFQSEELSRCFQSENLALEIQQSGVYLNGLIFAENKNKFSGNLLEQKPYLFGNWEKSNVNMSGILPEVTNCFPGQKTVLNIQAAWQNNTLNGKIIFNSLEYDFIAQKQVKPIESQKLE